MKISKSIRVYLSKVLVFCLLILATFGSGLSNGKTVYATGDVDGSVATAGSVIIEKEIDAYAGYFLKNDYSTEVTFAAVKGYTDYSAKLSDDTLNAVSAATVSAVSTGVTVSFNIKKKAPKGSYTVPIFARKGAGEAKESKVENPEESKAGTDESVQVEESEVSTEESLQVSNDSENPADTANAECVTVASVKINVIYVKETKSLKVKNGSNHIIVTPGTRGKVYMSITKSERAYNYEDLKAVVTKKQNVTSAKIDGTCVMPKVPKKCVKGKAESIFIASGDKNLEYKVIPRNKAKKLSIKKKKYKVKKGKEVSITFKVKAENNRYLVADKISAVWSNTSKAKAVKVVTKKGKVKVVVRGIKKGSTSFKLAIGSKRSSSVKVKVK
ncbi:MAG: hypothetical protein K6D02_06195 [Lachnospiraceae bacterium]|nr:hypothetical protein [Lachnospiraceae bacterium]